MTAQGLSTYSRRSFVGLAAGSGAVAVSGLAAIGATGRIAAAQDTYPSALPNGFPHQDPDLVRQTVAVSHGNLDAVRELVTKTPDLAKATWDWGFGDWESALGAASHTGSREIAALLIANGARPNLFTYAMLGHLDAVRAQIEATPGVQRVPGPHGITLLAHARFGGDEAKLVHEYLEELGDADLRAKNLKLETDEIEKYVGEYEVDGGNGELFKIVESRGRLGFQLGDEPRRFLMNQGDHEFHPAGATSVRFAFDMGEKQTRGVTVRNGHVVIKATRAG